jgi:hypothetical protein
LLGRRIAIEVSNGIEASPHDPDALYCFETGAQGDALGDVIAQLAQRATALLSSQPQGTHRLHGLSARHQLWR